MTNVNILSYTFEIGWRGFLSSLIQSSHTHASVFLLSKGAPFLSDVVHVQL